MANILSTLSTMAQGAANPQVVSAAQQLAQGVQSGSIQEQITHAENVAETYLASTLVLQAVAAAAALGIFILQMRTYGNVYGGVKANPRRRRRRARR